MDVEIRKAIRSRRTIGVYRIKWWNLNEENKTKLCERIKTEGKWRLEGDSNRIWEVMAGCTWRSAREVLGVSRGGSGRMEGAWWWSEEVKGKVKANQEKYKALIGS